VASIEQASGVVVRRGNGKSPRYLIVTARRNPENWLFPKGHIEEGETPEQAAVREVREEGGVDGKVIGRLGEFTFKTDLGKICCEYFLIEYERDVKMQESRERKWCTYEEAVTILTFEQSRAALAASRALVEPH
jgi:8-oxo-dGTP pyrophosphatase MutT (NUDIX family)